MTNNGTPGGNHPKITLHEERSTIGMDGFETIVFVEVRSELEDEYPDGDASYSVISRKDGLWDSRASTFGSDSSALGPFESETEAYRGVANHLLAILGVTARAYREPSNHFGRNGC